MDRIKKWLHQTPIPAAFIICGMTALLSALSLTRATMWFAQKNKDEIAASYAEPIPVEQEQLLDLNLTELEPLPPSEILPEEQVPQEEETHAQARQSDRKQDLVMYVLSPNAEIMLQEEDRKKYSFYEELDNIAAVLWYSVCLCLASLSFIFGK